MLIRQCSLQFLQLKSAISKTLPPRFRIPVEKNICELLFVCPKEHFLFCSSLSIQQKYFLFVNGYRV